MTKVARIRRLLLALFALSPAIGLSGCSLIPIAREVAGLLPGQAPVVAPSPTAPPVEADEPAPTRIAPRIERATPAPAPAVDYPLVDLYDRVNPAVVNIAVAALVGAPSSGTLPFGAPDSEGYLQQGEGSGFVYDLQGHIVTNYHVVRGAQRIEITFYNDLTAPATLVGGDPDSDLAVIKVDVEPEQLVPLPLSDSDLVRVGQPVVAIGNPFGLAGTMTSGIVSAVSRTMPAGGGEASSYTIPDIIQTDAAINPGNSGGPLLNLSGQVIGVNTAIESAVQSSAGVGFCVPSNIVAKVVPSLIELGYYDHPRLGISGWTVTSDWVQAASLAEGLRGVLVVEVTPDSPASAAGLRPCDNTVTVGAASYPVGGDVIVSIDGASVTKFDELISYLARYTEVGQTVTLGIVRGNRTIDVDLLLDARPH